MADIIMITQFWSTCVRKAWTVIEGYWFLIVPIFLVVMGNFIILAWSIAPGNHNRKH